MRKTLIAAIVLIILSFAVSAYFFPLMPESIASHWNAQGRGLTMKRYFRLDILNLEIQN